jgi:hypothetical protein
MQPLRKRSNKKSVGRYEILRKTGDPIRTVRSILIPIRRGNISSPPTLGSFNIQINTGPMPEDLSKREKQTGRDTCLLSQSSFEIWTA